MNDKNNIAEECSNRVFDSLVQELLTGKHPPDLAARINAAVRAEAARTSAVPVAPTSVTPTLPAIRSNSQPAKSPYIASELQASKRPAKGLNLIWSGAIAAGLVTCLIAWNIWPRARVDKPSQDVAKVEARPEANPEQHGRDSAATDDQSLAIAEQKVDPGLDGTVVQTDQSNTNSQTEPPPFSLDRELVNETAPEANQALPQLANRLTPSEVVEQLDFQLENLWNTASVGVGSNLSSVDLGQRISKTLTGQQLSDAELANLIDEKKQALNKTALIAAATDSIAFDRYWSQQLVSLWLGRTAASPQELDLAELLARRMHANANWNAVIAEMIGGELNTQDSLAGKFVGLLASGNNDLLVECIGANFLNQNATCLRCHDQTERNNLSRDQASYWSLIASFKGIERVGPELNLVDRQPELFAQTQPQGREPSVFFELPNGALREAFPQLPDQSEWRQHAAVPRQALAKWLADSSQLDRATVNSVWEIIFGDPLVAVTNTVPIGVEVVDSENRVVVERCDQILDFLSQQYRNSDRDLKQLIGWIVSCQAFSLQCSPLSQEQWRNLSDAQIVRRITAQQSFACGPKLPSKPTSSLRENIRYALQWRSTNKPSAMLAQPSIGVDKNAQPMPTNSSSSLPDFNASFALYNTQPSAHEIAYVNRLLQSQRLTWPERVQHVIELRKNTRANDELQVLANQLLEQHSGNAAAALQDLLWATQTN
jgi:Protein of unknown function (DUF1553)